MPPPHQSYAGKQKAVAPQVSISAESWDGSRGSVAAKKTIPEHGLEGTQFQASPEKTDSGPLEYASVEPQQQPVHDQYAPIQNTATFGSVESKNEMAAVQQEKYHQPVADGWGVDDVDDNFLYSEETPTGDQVLEDSPLELSVEPTPRKPPIADRPKPQERPLIADVDYNSDDDIIETRRRWTNPRPNRPYLAI
jgi:hypothetical protein